MKNFSNPIFLFIGLLLVATSVFAQPVNVTYSHTDPLDPNGIIWSPVYNPGSLPEIFFVANQNNGIETILSNAYDDGSLIKSIKIPNLIDAQILYTDDFGVVVAGRDIGIANALVVYKFSHALTLGWNLVVNDVLNASTLQNNIAMLKYYIGTNEHYMIAMTGDGFAIDPTTLSVNAISAVSIDALGNLIWAKFYNNTSTNLQSDLVSTITEYSVSGISYYALGGTSSFQGQVSLFTLPIDEWGTIVASCNFYSTGSVLENPILKWDGNDMICAYTDGAMLAVGVNNAASLFKLDVNSGYAPFLGNYIWQGTNNKATGLEIRAGEYVLAMEVEGNNPNIGSLSSDKQLASAIINPISLTTTSFSRYNLLQNHSAKVNNATIDTAGEVYMVGTHIVGGGVDQLRMINVDNGGTTCQAVFLNAGNIPFQINHTYETYGEINVGQFYNHSPNVQFDTLYFRDCDANLNGDAYKPNSIGTTASGAIYQAVVYPTLLNELDQNVTVDVRNIYEDLNIEVIDLLGRKIWETDSRNHPNRMIQIPATYFATGLSVVKIFGQTYSKSFKISKR